MASVARAFSFGSGGGDKRGGSGGDKRGGGSDRHGSGSGKDKDKSKSKSKSKDKDKDRKAKKSKKGSNSKSSSKDKPGEEEEEEEEEDTWEQWEEEQERRRRNSISGLYFADNDIAFNFQGDAYNSQGTVISPLGNANFQMTMHGRDIGRHDAIQHRRRIDPVQEEGPNYPPDDAEANAWDANGNPKWF